MNIEHMRTFLELHSSSSFQLTAERLHVTQSTVSARIKALEERLNQTLIIRKRNGSKLSAAGRLFHPHALTVVQAWERARQEIALPEDLDGVFSLGIQLNHWDYIATQWLTFMQKSNPTIATRVIADYSDPLMTQLRDGQLDMAILYAPTNHPNIQIEAFNNESLYLVSTEPRELQVGRTPGYIFVDWGDEFRAQHNLAFPKTFIPKMSVGLGSFGLNQILTHGGSGYFLESSIKPYLQNKSLFLVENAPVFNRPTYLGYPISTENKNLQQSAVQALKSINIVN
jgi:DNA-binding transcriptional LysR family regulator